MRTIYKIAAIVLSLGLLFTAGCASSGKAPETAGTDIAKAAAESAAAETPVPETAGRISDDASLNSLRQAMTETPALFAVAYFGCHDTADSGLPVDPYEAMQAYAYWLCQDMPFLLQIPQDRVIGEGGDLFCIVPLDEDATVSVCQGAWNAGSEQYLYEKTRYFGKTGEPILLMCNRDGFEPDTQLCISGPSGDVIWYPRIDDNHCVMPLRNDSWDNLFLDFSSYRELLMKRHRDMKGEWVMPTAEMLADTTWGWDGLLKDGRAVSYQMSFRQDTLSVRWNDGIDAEDHVYPDAAWELTYDEGFAILSIDFREFAGVLRYNLLYHEDYALMYTAMDAVQEEMPIGWEPQYRFLSPQEIPEPEEMPGRWALAWTEAEGDRTEAEPRTEYIDIFLNADNGFRITLTDGARPAGSFRNKELAVYEGALYSGCGNDLWMAYVGYMGSGDTIYSLTLLPDDTLLMQLYWEIDGGVPMTALKCYRRME